MATNIDPKHCRSCGAAIYWAKHHITGKIAPIDATPALDGNVELSEDRQTYKVLLRTERPSEEGSVHKSHWATCPFAEQHGKKAG